MEKVFLNDNVFISIPLSEKERRNAELLIEAKCTRFFAELTDREILGVILGARDTWSGALECAQDFIDLTITKEQK